MVAMLHVNASGGNVTAVLTNSVFFFVRVNKKEQSHREKRKKEKKHLETCGGPDSQTAYHARGLK